MPKIKCSTFVFSALAGDYHVEYHISNEKSKSEGIMVESSSLGRTPPAAQQPIPQQHSPSPSGLRCGNMETRVRGAWYRVLVTLETDFLAVSLDESCEAAQPSNDGQSTTLNGTLG